MITRNEVEKKMIFQLNFNKNKENKILLISKILNDSYDLYFDLETNLRFKDFLFHFKYGSTNKSVSFVHLINTLTCYGLEISKDVNILNYYR